MANPSTYLGTLSALIYVALPLVVAPGDAGFALEAVITDQFAASAMPAFTFADEVAQARLCRRFHSVFADGSVICALFV